MSSSCSGTGWGRARRSNRLASWGSRRTAWGAGAAGLTRHFRRGLDGGLEIVLMEGIGVVRGSEELQAFEKDRIFASAQGPRKNCARAGTIGYETHDLL